LRPSAHRQCARQSVNVASVRPSSSLIGGKASTSADQVVVRIAGTVFESKAKNLVAAVTPQLCGGITETSNGLLTGSRCSLEQKSQEPSRVNGGTQWPRQPNLLA
jgi:hypothetical protein